SAEDRAFDRMLLGDSLAAMAAPQQSLVNASSGNLPFTFLAMDGSGHFAPQNPIELFGRRAAAETSFGEGFKAQVSDTASGAWTGIVNFGLDSFDGWRGVQGTRSGFYRNVNEMGLGKTLVYYGAQATLAPWMTGGSIVDSGVRTAVNLSKGEMGAAGRSTVQLLESTSMAALSVVGGRQGLSMRSSFAVGERIAIGEGFASTGIGNVEGAATSRMAELQAKWGGLTAGERRALLESKSEATWGNWLDQRDATATAVNPNTHFLEKHGPGTTLLDQEIRASTKLAPDGSIDPAFRDSTRFLSNRDMGAAMQRADSIFQLNGGVNKAYSFKMEGLIGEGYTKSPGLDWMFTTNVNAVFRNGQPYTIFPLLRPMP
ncbi:hypothetical protein ACS5PK_22550, partial [Roseateles sp. DB2]|uniref:hypothetical protein n=1 Tax=Roseateles sp. DB2 TaxID=3453717 RepID=UPI003EEB46CF